MNTTNETTEINEELADQLAYEEYLHNLYSQFRLAEESAENTN